MFHWLSLKRSACTVIIGERRSLVGKEEYIGTKKAEHYQLVMFSQGEGNVRKIAKKKVLMYSVDNLVDRNFR